MATWKFHEAKARLSEVIDTAKKKGPQIVTRRGVEEAVIVPIDEWRRLQAQSRPSLKDLLLGPGPYLDDVVIERIRPSRLRKPVEFE